MCKQTLCLVMKIINEKESLLLSLLLLLLLLLVLLLLLLLLLLLSSFCNIDFDIDNMGISAFNSHAAGKEHINIVKGASIFFTSEE